MRYAMAILLFPLFGCTAGKSPENALMDDIEASLKLPGGARAFGDYARYYTYWKAGKVVVIYVIPSGPPESGADCFAISSNLASTPCPDGDVKAMDNREHAQFERELRTGQRRWSARLEDI